MASPVRARAPFLRRYGLPFAHWYIGGVAALVATNGLSVMIPVHLAQGIDAFGVPGGEVVAARAAATVAAMGAAVIGIRTASRLLFFTPGRLVEARLMHDLFAATLLQQPDFFAKVSAGDLTSRLTGDVVQARLLFGFTALGLINTAVAVVVAGAQLVSLSTGLGLLVAAPLLGAFLLTVRAVDRLRTLQKRYQEELAAVSDHTLASFQGVSAVHAFGAGPALVERFRAVNGALLRTQVERSGLRVAIGPLLGLAATADVFLVLWLGGPMALTGDLTVGEIVAFIAIVGYLVAPLRGLTFTLSVIRQSSVSVDRLEAVLAAVPFRPERSGGAGAATTSGGEAGSSYGPAPEPRPAEEIGPEPKPAPSAPPTIRLDGLSYRYPGADRDALQDVSVEVPAGGVLGVFGPTGSGKSTLVRCLLRLADPPPGTVLVDGVDLRAVDLDAWRRAAVLVPQRAFLYSESLRSNILLGQSDARLDELIEAAQLRVDVNALPEGVETVVGEAGLTLSGGQRQRVALARGLARDARVLVLDDVLSAVDPATEAALISTLRSRPGCPTTVIVSNRVSALRHADVIVVLDHGRMIARGRHRELLARPGPYRDAAERQSEGSALSPEPR